MLALVWASVLSSSGPGSAPLACPRSGKCARSRLDEQSWISSPAPPRLSEQFWISCRLLTVVSVSALALVWVSGPELAIARSPSRGRAVQDRLPPSHRRFGDWASNSQLAQLTRPRLGDRARSRAVQDQLRSLTLGWASSSGVVAALSPSFR